jgi:hypothetical protein
MKVTDEMVNRFLCWKLPVDFHPDAGISFTPEYNQNTPYPAKHEPVGTNLFSADQARQMLEHVLANDTETVEAYGLWSNEMYIREEGQVGVIHGRLFDTPEAAKTFFETSEPHSLKNGTFVKVAAEKLK